MLSPFVLPVCEARLCSAVSSTLAWPGSTHPSVILSGLQLDRMLITCNACGRNTPSVASGLQMNIPNPLKAFVAQEDLGDVQTSSDIFNPMSRPKYQVRAHGMKRAAQS